VRRGASGLRQFVLDQSIDPFDGGELAREAVARHCHGDARVDVDAIPFAVEPAQN
jgi:hypothetical protein